jgi:hypothetical protein
MTHQPVRIAFPIFCLLIFLTGCASLPLHSASDLLLAESFDLKPGEMDTYSRDTGSAGQQDGEFQIRVLAPNYMQWSMVHLNASDVVIQVQTRKAGGPDDNLMGVICRYQDDLNFYFMVISSDGYYGIGRMLKGERTLLTGQTLLPSVWVQGGNAVNTLKVTCSGSRLSLEVNGEALASVEDTSLTDGQAGLLAGDFADTGTDIRFDNLMINRSSQ